MIAREELQQVKEKTKERQSYKVNYNIHSDDNYHDRVV